jgi:hypothetical protein
MHLQIWDQTTLALNRESATLTVAHLEWAGSLKKDLWESETG